jgi:hypothetical protein
MRPRASGRATLIPNSLIIGPARLHRLARLSAGRQAWRGRRATGGLTMLQRFVDAAAVAAEIELSGDGLRRRWQAVFGRSPRETSHHPPLDLSVA